MDHFKIKIGDGFYWCTGRKDRRYGRVTATESQAFVVCESHATQLVNLFSQFANVEMIKVESDECDDCKKTVGLKQTT